MSEKKRENGVQLAVSFWAVRRVVIHLQITLLRLIYCLSGLYLVPRRRGTAGLVIDSGHVGWCHRISQSGKGRRDLAAA